MIGFGMKWAQLLGRGTTGQPTREGDDDPPVKVERKPHELTELPPVRNGIKPPSPLFVGTMEDTFAPGAVKKLSAFLQLHRIEYFLGSEFCYLPKADVFAMPPAGYWQNIVRVLQVADEIRGAMNQPLAIRGYRPPEYNRAVGGASRSRHMWAQAVDIRIPTGGPKPREDREARRILAFLAARIYLNRGDALKLGLGVYGPHPYPSHIHIDVGYRKRCWGSAGAFIDEVKGAANA